MFLGKRCDVAPVAGRQLVPSLCRTPDHSKSLIEAFLKSNPGDELFWTRHCPGGGRGESDHVPRIAEERARVRHTFDGSSRLLSKSAQFDGLSNESSQLGFKFESDHVPRMRGKGASPYDRSELHLSFDPHRRRYSHPQQYHRCKIKPRVCVHESEA